MVLEDNHRADETVERVEDGTIAADVSESALFMVVVVAVVVVLDENDAGVAIVLLLPPPLLCCDCDRVTVVFERRSRS